MAKLGSLSALVNSNSIMRRENKTLGWYLGNTTVPSPEQVPKLSSERKNKQKIAAARGTKQVWTEIGGAELATHPKEKPDNYWYYEEASDGYYYIGNGVRGWRRRNSKFVAAQEQQTAAVGQTGHRQDGFFYERDSMLGWRREQPESRPQQKQQSESPKGRQKSPHSQYQMSQQQHWESGALDQMEQLKTTALDHHQQHQQVFNWAFTEEQQQCCCTARPPGRQMCCAQFGKLVEQLVRQKHRQMMQVLSEGHLMSDSAKCIFGGVEGNDLLEQFSQEMGNSSSTSSDFCSESRTFNVDKFIADLPPMLRPFGDGSGESSCSVSPPLSPFQNTQKDLWPPAYGYDADLWTYQ